VPPVCGASAFFPTRSAPRVRVARRIVRAPTGSESAIRDESRASASQERAVEGWPGHTTVSSRSWEQSLGSMGPRWARNPGWNPGRSRWLCRGAN
jgi:hypothetical protein